MYVDDNGVVLTKETLLNDRQAGYRAGSETGDALQDGDVDPSTLGYGQRGSEVVEIWDEEMWVEYMRVSTGSKERVCCCKDSWSKLRALRNWRWIRAGLNI